MSSNFHVFLPEPPCKMSLSTPPVSWMLPESDIPLAIQPRKSYNKSINCAFYIISGCGCRMDTYAYLAHLTEDGRTQTILEHLKAPRLCVPLSQLLLTQRRRDSWPVWLTTSENTPLPFSGGSMSGRKWITPLPVLSSV